MCSPNSIKTKDFKRVLTKLGLVKKGGKGSHERWSKPKMSRPVIFQATKKIMPRHVLLSNLKTLKLTMNGFCDILKKL